MMKGSSGSSTTLHSEETPRRKSITPDNMPAISNEGSEGTDAPSVTLTYCRPPLPVTRSREGGDSVC